MGHIYTMREKGSNTSDRGKQHKENIWIKYFTPDVTVRKSARLIRRFQLGTVKREREREWKYSSIYEKQLVLLPKYKTGKSFICSEIVTALQLFFFPFAFAKERHCCIRYLLHQTKKKTTQKTPCFVFLLNSYIIRWIISCVCVSVCWREQAR